MSDLIEKVAKSIAVSCKSDLPYQFAAKSIISMCQEQQAEEIQSLKSKYHELLYQVAKKFPDESRHETALRYIRQAENHDNGPEKVDQPKDTGA